MDYYFVEIIKKNIQCVQTLIFLLVPYALFFWVTLYVLHYLNV